MGYVQVVDKEFENTVGFEDLKTGETFRYGGKIHLKYSQSCGAMYNAFVFSDNCLVSFNSKCQVIPVKCKLVVED